jgi:hypothetical protein
MRAGIPGGLSCSAARDRHVATGQLRPRENYAEKEVLSWLKEGVAMGLGQKVSMIS